LTDSDHSAPACCD